MDLVNVSPYIGKGIFMKSVNAVETVEIQKLLTDARNEWLDAVSSFEHAYEEMLVDYYTYKMKACEARYTYFIKLAKEKGVTCPALNIAGAV